MLDWAQHLTVTRSCGRPFTATCSGSDCRSPRHSANDRVVGTDVPRLRVRRLRSVDIASPSSPTQRRHEQCRFTYTHLWAGPCDRHRLLLALRTPQELKSLGPLRVSPCLRASVLILFRDLR